MSHQDSIDLAQEGERDQCENRFQPRKKKWPAMKTSVPIEHKREKKLCLHTGSNTGQDQLLNCSAKPPTHILFEMAQLTP